MRNGVDIMEKSITKLPSRPSLQRLTRVAAYARVSTGKDAMQHSLAAQVSYYSDLIQHHPGWRYAGVYADEAFTGTKDTRPEFQRLLEDCRAGRIDMIVTKSISRFARNTVTTLQTVRELKALGVDVFFEEQNLHSISSEGELLLTIFSAFAQEESRSASDNQKWRIHKAFENGELMNLRTMFGYRISKENGIQIDPEKADIVREMYARVIRGESLSSIARWLDRSGYRGALGGKWSPVWVRATLANEKYAGNSLLQKEYRNNHIDKKRMKNRGELPQYYATETHPAIIDEATFEAAQQVLARIAAQSTASKARSRHAFTGMIICSGCGKRYKRVNNHGIPCWACPTYVSDGKQACPCRKIPEDVIMRLACELFGWNGFDEDAFRNTVDHLTAVYPNTLIFHCKDGREVRTEWQNRSRAESWTPEMKENARTAARRGMPR